jgi:hypothetical protein
MARGVEIEFVVNPEARLRRAVEIVREQRDPNGEFGALGHPEHGLVASTAVEAMYLQEIERIQRAVMGEDEPEKS